MVQVGRTLIIAAVCFSSEVPEMVSHVLLTRPDVRKPAAEDEDYDDKQNTDTPELHHLPRACVFIAGAHARKLHKRLAEIAHEVLYCHPDEGRNDIYFDFDFR